MTIRTLIFVLFAGFFSSSFHFFFPFLTLIYLDFGFTSVEALGLVSLSVLIAAMLLPFFGWQLDHGKSDFAFLGAAVGFTLGLVTFWQGFRIPRAFLIVSSMAFVVSTTFLYLTSRRLTEGVALESGYKAKGRVSLSFFFENASLAVAAFFASLFLEKYLRQLLIIDAISSLVFLSILYAVQRRLRNKVPPVTSGTSLRETFSRLFKNNAPMLIATMLVMVSLYSLFSGLQIVYTHIFDEPKKMTALMKTTNTVVVSLASLAFAYRPLSGTTSNHFLVSTLLVSLGYALVPWMLFPIGIIATTIVWSAGEALFYPTLVALFLASFPSGQPGTAIGSKDMWVRISLAMAPLVSSMANVLPVKAYGLYIGAIPLVALLVFYGYQRRAVARFVAVLLWIGLAPAVQAAHPRCNVQLTATEANEMNKVDIRRALAEEETIWRLVYPHQIIPNGDWRAYWYTKFPEMTHWNTAYPIGATTSPSPRSLEELTGVYDSLGSKGYAMLIGETELLGEEHEYFLWTKDRPAPKTAEVPSGFSIAPTSDLKEFSKVVKLAFGLEDNFVDDFRQQLETIAQTHAAQHWIARIHGEIVGCISSFQTDGRFEFLMNYGVLPAFRGRNLSHVILNHVLSVSQHPVLIRTANPTLRKKVFPAAGFESLGSARLVPVDAMGLGAGGG